jgi:hypothetical protein
MMSPDAIGVHRATTLSIASDIGRNPRCATIPARPSPVLTAFVCDAVRLRIASYAPVFVSAAATAVGAAGKQHAARGTQDGGISLQDFGRL